MNDYPALFAKAKRPETLLLMVKRQVRELRYVRFNEAREGYEDAAEHYARQHYPRAENLFRAAFERFTEIKSYGYERHLLNELIQ